MNQINQLSNTKSENNMQDTQQKSVPVPQKCPNCGAKNSFARVAQQGRTVVYQGVKIVLPEDLQLTTCQECQEMLLDDAEGDAYFDAIQQEYSKITSKNVHDRLSNVAELLRKILHKYEVPHESGDEQLKIDYTEHNQDMNSLIQDILRIEEKYCRK